MEYKYISLLQSKLSEIVLLYSEVWGEHSVDFAERLKRHANYPGFKTVVALNDDDDDDDAIGFAYGYTSKPGQYYHEQLRKALSKSNQDWWLDDCFEFVELVVHPNQRRKYKGQELAANLLEDIQNKTAVLTTQMNNISARNLYKKLNWEILEENFKPGDSKDPYVIMGKKLIP
ncbi:N-acetyltransferase [Paucisalibacillus sp. EB02]|uniref:GNAT family N-acetyltransferase n=1 Tax=Paucisalibacillus sp. EB02 TaxID=1347087 RepID=UPI0005A6F842|nr:GNAT family N-acetyltransferase [Paucisalibacillus sp. EB02]